MPAKPIAINLLGQEDLKHTPQGRIVSWALTYGRYIMIGTEIVVLLAFISRFSLDRKLTDLKEDISQKQAILEANVQIEEDVRGLQDHLSKIKQVLAGQAVLTEALKTIQTLLPEDVSLTTLDISADRLSAAAVAATTNGFSQFLAGLQSSKLFSRINLGDINKSGSSGIEFTFTAYLPHKK